MKTQKFENPSKTIVFPMYFEGWVLKYQVTICEKMDINIVSKSIIKINEKNTFLEHFGLRKTFQNTAKSKVKNKRFPSVQKDDPKVLQ